MLKWYLHTADAAQGWINPAEDRVPLTPASDDVSPLTFSDYDAAVDWAEREHANLLQAVRTAADAGQDRLAWQLATVLWNAQFPSASGTSWPPVGRIGLEAAERLGERAAQGALHTYLGMAYTRINHQAESLESHENALTIRRDLDDRLGEARSLNLIGLNHLRARRLDTAARHFEQAISAFQEQDAAHWAATALSNLATTHYRAGRLPEAATAIDQALAAHRTLNDQRGEGNILRVLSDVQREQGDIEASLASAQAALDIALNLRSLRLEGFLAADPGRCPAGERPVRRGPDLLPALRHTPPTPRRPQPRGAGLAGRRRGLPPTRASCRGGRLPPPGCLDAPRSR
ncbi:hypothetical protein GCM10010390_47030 [Streptomyces mordarskii]|uniref:Tetratricopeptide repeat protein n=1 Tax=Streptomyces mordarskii TaxID=1226758 RepID=A0ABN1DC98_9ACTN